MGTREDISSKIIIDHYKHIVKNNMYYFVKNFTFYGSSVINKFLRTSKNNDIVENYNRMYQLIANAPKFDKNYYVYRFVSNDLFLQNLNIGDVFTDKGFMSTTRNPFY